MQFWTCQLRKFLLIRYSSRPNCKSGVEATFYSWKNFITYLNLLGSTIIRVPPKEGHSLPNLVPFCCKRKAKKRVFLFRRVIIWEKRGFLVFRIVPGMRLTPSPPFKDLDKFHQPTSLQLGKGRHIVFADGYMKCISLLSKSNDWEIEYLGKKDIKNIKIML